MEKAVFVAKKLKVGDIVNLSDTSAEQLRQLAGVKTEDIITLETPFNLHKANVVYVDKSTVEVEILNADELTKQFSGNRLTILQAVSGDRKFEYFLEKTIEVGVSDIFPIITDHMLIKEKGAYGAVKDWEIQLDKAIEQSRTRFPSRLNPIHKIGDGLTRSLNQLTDKNTLKVVLSTDLVETKSFQTIIENHVASHKQPINIVVAVGPEKGWSSRELKYFRHNGFLFASLGANILRTETAGVVVASLFNYISGFYK